MSATEWNNEIIPLLSQTWGVHTSMGNIAYRENMSPWTSKTKCVSDFFEVRLLFKNLTGDLTVEKVCTKVLPNEFIIEQNVRKKVSKGLMKIPIFFTCAQSWYKVVSQEWPTRNFLRLKKAQGWVKWRSNQCWFVPLTVRVYKVLVPIE